MKVKYMNTLKRSLLGMLAITAFAAQAQEQPVIEAKLVNEGVQLDGGSMGKFNLTYPLMNFGGDDIRSKPVEVRLNGNKAELKYKNNGAVAVTVEGGKFTYAFTTVPNGLKSTSHQMFVPFNYNQGGTWGVDDQGGPFPAQKPTEGKIFIVYKGPGPVYKGPGPMGNRSGPRTPAPRTLASCRCTHPPRNRPDPHIRPACRRRGPF